MKHLESSHSPSIGASILAPIARLSRDVQNGAMKLIGLKNAKTAGALVLATGLAITTILGPVGVPVIAAGGIALVENGLTDQVAKWDGKGNTQKH